MYDLKAIAYVESEVVFGSELAEVRDAYIQTEANVGVSQSRSLKSAFYSDILVVSETVAAPPPIIFTVRPDAAKRTEEFRVFGHGFGSSQAQFSGIIQGRDPTNTWQNLTVISWDRIAANGDAYTSNRVVDLDAAEPDIDTEHEVITAVVPIWAVPISMAIRVVTDGP